MVAHLEVSDKTCPQAPIDRLQYSDPAHVEALSLLAKLQVAGTGSRLESSYLDFASAPDVYSPSPSSSSRLMSYASETQTASFSKGKSSVPNESPATSDNFDSAAPANDFSRGKTVSEGGGLGEQPALESSRENLLKLASKDITGAGNLQTFEKDMNAFEQRMMPASPVEVQQFYTQMARLLNDPSSVMSESNKILLAEGIMHDAANPDAIRQGASNDCVSASLESRAYSRNPAQAAKTVIDVALTGSYTTSDGRIITPNGGIDKPIKNDQFGGYERSFSDQIFQITAMNTYMDTKNQLNHTPGRFEYQIVPSSVPEFPYEERQIDNSTKPPTSTAMDGIAVPGNDLEQLYQKMTGIACSNFYINNSSDDSLPEIQQTLLRAGRTGQFPLEAMVDIDNPLLDQDFAVLKNLPSYKALETDLSKHGVSEQQLEDYVRQGDHALAVESYDPKTETVTYMDAEMGKTYKTSLVDFVKAMDVTPYPQAGEEFYAFAQKDHNPFVQRTMDFFNSVPKSQRQEIYSELLADSDLLPDILSDAQLKAIGLTETDTSDQ